MKTVIVGAGMCGLVLARELWVCGHDVRVLEKSKGVGGRLATRRTENGKFDHGAQFYLKSESLDDLHQEWESSNLSRIWHRFEESHGKSTERFISANGMTDFAKYLLKSSRGDVPVLLQHKVVGIERQMERSQGETTGSWSIQIEGKENLSCELLILTAPLPQSLELLETSQIDFPVELKAAKYAKAIVVLLEGIRNYNSILSENEYSENLSNEIFSLSNQQSKGLNTKTALTVVMSPSFSEIWFEKPEEIVIEQVIAALRRAVGDFDYDALQVKKWRYSHLMTNPLPGMFCELPGNLFLVGDAFSGSSVGRTVASAKALLGYLA
jgi:renalase